MSEYSYDPMLLFPSIEVYPSSIYGASESGMYFGHAASPTSQDLDPYFFFAETDFGLVVKDGSGSGNLNARKSPVIDQVKTVGLKGPLYYSAWGYDVAGLPVPHNVLDLPSGIKTAGNRGYLNESGEYVDSPAVSGEYQFHPESSKRRSLWKTGPLDFRWHDKRKVWVGGPEILEGYLLEDLDGVSEARMKVYRNIVDDDFESQIDEEITIKSRDPSLSASSGTYCMAIDINYEWRPIWVGC